MRFEIHRDADVKRLFKVCIELVDEAGEVVDRRYTHSFPLFNFAKRLERKKRRMLRCAGIMLNATK